MEARERLQKYSGANVQTCEAQLAIRYGNFWEALFYLTMSVNDKDALVEKLYSTDTIEELVAILKRLKEIYGGWDFSDVKSRVFDDDEEFYMSNKPTGKEGQYSIVPKTLEIEKYTALLTSPDPMILATVLKVLGMINVTYFNTEIIGEMKKLLTGKNVNLANDVMGTNCADQPEKAELFFDEIRFNLKPNRSQNHFNAIRTFWSKNIPVYPEITEEVHRLTRSGNSQVRDMANDVLVRYGQISPEEKAAAELRRRNSEVQTIHYTVEKIKSAKALYTFADKFNWDEDVEYMFAVIRHELCEVATAKLVYWRSEPNYYQKFTAVEQVEEYHQDIYRLQRTIEQGMENGNYPSGKLKYKPVNDHGFDGTLSTIAESDVKRAIPACMY